MTEMVHGSKGEAKFACKKCSREVTLAWEAGYPAISAPTCEHGEMKQVSAPYEAVITEDELLEREVRAELAAEQLRSNREARKTAIRERLLQG